MTDKSPSPNTECHSSSSGNDSTADEFTGAYSVSNMESFSREHEETLLQPFRYILQVPGKMIRSKLALAFNFWLKIPQEKLTAISEIILLLHNASLLIDDIEDGSTLRRGIPVAHSIYGIGSTINSANYVYFLGLQKTLALEHPQAVNVFCEQLLELHRGQGLDIHWRDSFACPTEEQYKQMTICKTGGLFGLAIRLMQLFSDCDASFSKLMDILGLYFQIRDDYANLCTQEYCDSKGYCDDLTEGKFSFPIIHAIHSRPKCQQIINIIRQRPKDVEVKKYCVSLLQKYGSLAYTRDMLQQLDSQAREEVKKLGDNPMLVEILDTLQSSLNSSPL
ncbi:geranylgeranyl pyrophosphate synthase [Hyalella azteca]|uniref:Geranylgeranyl pyrophosphate synthase n=1 Tax=Hyalella azteca TaxID=294128 RepID=A0A8B7PM95_HYAAZ|nr:geranylgeranyl pyrophosphate synthase [Hyalella azteca]